MKVSELIKTLKYMQETYGDLDVTISLDNKGKYLSSEKMFVTYNQFEDHDEIDLRDFPY